MVWLENSLWNVTDFPQKATIPKQPNTPSLGYTGKLVSSDRLSVFRKNQQTRLPQFPPAGCLPGNSGYRIGDWGQASPVS
jgi:hypothetical protein